MFNPSLMESWLTLFRLMQELHYPNRGRARDKKCLVTGLKIPTYSRLKVAHIFPRAHDIEVTDLYLSYSC